MPRPVTGFMSDHGTFHLTKSEARRAELTHAQRNLFNEFQGRHGGIEVYSLESLLCLKDRLEAIFQLEDEKPAKG